MHPREVTVAIPCYNAADDLREVLNSIADLTATPARVVCIDDGSNDRTVDIAQSHQNVDVVERETTGGVAATRNTALEIVETPGLAMVDPDITLPDDWLSSVTSAITEERVDVVACQTEEQVLNRADRWRQLHAPVTIYEGQVRDVPIASANVLFRVEALKAVNGWDERFELAYEDTDLCNRLLAADYSILLLDEPVCLHRKTSHWRTVVLSFYYYYKLPKSRDWEVLTPLGILLRIAGHMIALARCLKADVQTRQYDLIPISLLMLPMFIWMDLQKFQAKFRGHERTSGRLDNSEE